MTVQTFDQASNWPGRRLRPAVGFLHPMEVVKDPDLKPSAKREILAAWASDACALKDRPTQRWLVGTSVPVALAEVLAALKRLDAATAQ
jgi:hypothetical protein